MLGEDKKQEIISNAINAAICIDDKYVLPYSEAKQDDVNYNDAKDLYQSFREQGKCALDIYKYIDIDTFIRDKSYLLNHKELMILDWELNEEAQGIAKFKDALKVLECAVSDKHIRCVTIYTQAEDLQLILLQIYSYFSRVYSIDEINKKIEDIVEFIAGKIEEFSDIDDGLSFFKTLLNDKSSGFSSLPEKNQDNILKDLKTAVTGHVAVKDRKELCASIKDEMKRQLLQDEKLALSCYEIIQRKEIDDYKYTSEFPHFVEVYDGEYLLVDNTIIFVLNKRNTNVLSVYKRITEAIYNIPNHRTLLLSLMIRNILYDNVGISGKGLGKVTDKMLMHHWQSYEHQDIDDLIAFLVLCMKEDLAVSLNNNIDSEDLRELFDLKAGEKIEADCKELALFNKIITFVDKKDLVNKKNHKLKTGDIFKLTSRLYEPTKKGERVVADYDEYLICITQGCDCLRAKNNICNNFAFAYGTTYNVNMSTALRSIESDDKYTIVNENTAIEWKDNFLTIHIEHNDFDVNNCISVNIDDSTIELEYVGNLKDFYAQRIINKVFNHALRIGVDLPHYKKS